MAKSNQIDMTEGPILGKLLQFSVPLILSSMLQLLFNAADVIVVGKFAGDDSLAAVGSTGSIINLLVNLFIGLSVGSNVIAANYFGCGNHKKIHQTVHTSILLSIYSGLILTVVGVVFAKGILILMQSPAEVLDLATTYLQFYFGGITATIIYNFGSALLRAKGDTRRPLYILFASGLLNVVLNLLFVIVFKMNVAGVAIATVISQCLSAWLVIRCLIKDEDDFKLELKKLHIDREIFIDIVKIGVPAGFQGIMFSLSNVIIQSSINSFGKIVVAGNSAASNLEGFVYFSMNGFAQGTLTYVSQNKGARKYDRIGKVVFLSILIVVVVGELLGNLAYFFGDKLLTLYTESDNSSEVIQAGLVRLSVICTTYALCGIMDVAGSAVRGMGHSLLPMIVTVVGVCVLRLLWIFTICQIPAFHNTFTLFLSYPISWAITFAVHLVCFIVIFKKASKKDVSKQD